MFYSNENSYGEDPNKKKSIVPKILRWVIYLLCILIIIVVIYRSISIGAPKELENYIIKTPGIEESYKNLKDKFKIYEIDLRNPFGWGDALFIAKLYYLEDAENLQVTMRCKTGRFEFLSDSFWGASSIRPFAAYVKLSEMTADDKPEIDSARDNIIYSYLSNMFGNYSDKYIYYVYSFDNVKIDYEKSKVELYIFTNSPSEITRYDEDKALARFTLFDANMTRTKLQAKKFMPDE